MLPVGEHVGGIAVGPALDPDLLQLIVIDASLGSSPYKCCANRPEFRSSTCILLPIMDISQSHALVAHARFERIPHHGGTADTRASLGVVQLVNATRARNVAQTRRAARRRAFRNRPVCELFAVAIISGVPVATTSPPA